MWLELITDQVKVSFLFLKQLIGSMWQINDHLPSNLLFLSADLLIDTLYASKTLMLFNCDVRKSLTLVCKATCAQHMLNETFFLFQICT